MLPEAVYLVNHAIDIVWQRRTLLAEPQVKLAQSGDPVHHAPLSGYRKAQRRQPIHECCVRCRQCYAIHGADAVGKESQWPRGGQFGIELSQRACSCVAGIDKQFLAFGGLTRIELVEIFSQHHHLAAYFQQRRSLPVRQGERDGANGLQIFGDTFAHRAIPARSALNKDAIHIGKADREPIELGFTRIFDFRCLKLQTFAAAAVKIINILSRESIAQ